ncbi:MAG TPA: glycosyltransferase family 9 protein [Kiritimatiellia bacterium]|nr:glycosyltransferase family 9 protein [Kiritimatiellia bacterium]
MIRPRDRVLVVKLSSLGDVFHALPAVDQLRRELELTVDWVTHPAYVDVVSCFEGIRKVIACPRRKVFSRAGEFLGELRRERYDVVLDFQGLQKSAWVSRLARAGLRVGPSFHREGSRLLYHEVTGARNKERHAVEECLDAVRWAGLTPGEVSFPVSFPRPEEVLPDSPRVGLLPCSRWETKNWPPEHFAEVARGLMETRNASVFLFGAREDEEVCRSIATLAPGCLNRCGRTSLPELGGYLARMDVVVCVDSGPMHVAAAAGTRVVAVFGATSALRTGPFGDRHRVLARELGCRPCLSRTCRLPERDIRCLRDLGPEVVLGTVAGLLH